MSNDVVEIVEINNPEVHEIPVLKNLEGLSSGVDLDTVYRLTEFAHKVKEGLWLTKLEWDVYFSIDVEASIKDLSLALVLPASSIAPAVQRLMAINVLVPREAISYTEYRATKSQPVHQSVVDLVTQEEFIVNIPMESEFDSSDISSAREKKTIADLTPNKGVPEFPPSGIINNLRCLVELVCRYKGDDRRGKLAVYRIFLRVPREDFVSLGFGSFLFLNNKEKDTPVSGELLSRLMEATEMELGKHPNAIYNELKSIGRLPESCLTH